MSERIRGGESAMTTPLSCPREGPGTREVQGTWKGRGEVATSAPDPKPRERSDPPRAETGGGGEREGQAECSPPLVGVLIPGCWVNRAGNESREGGIIASPSLSRERNVYWVGIT